MLYTPIVIEDYHKPECFFIRKDMIIFANDGKITGFKNSLITQCIESQLVFDDRKMEDITIYSDQDLDRSYILRKLDRSGDVRYEIAPEK